MVSAVPHYTFTAIYPLRTLDGDEAFLHVEREAVAPTWREAIRQVGLPWRHLRRLEVRIEDEAEVLHVHAEEVPT